MFPGRLRVRRGAGINVHPSEGWGKKGMIREGRRGERQIRLGEREEEKGRLGGGKMELGMSP